MMHYDDPEDRLLGPDDGPEFGGCAGVVVAVGLTLVGFGLLYIFSALF